MLVKGFKDSFRGTARYWADTDPDPLTREASGTLSRGSCGPGRMQRFGEVGAYGATLRLVMHVHKDFECVGAVSTVI